jgi:pimeloyl-ACP methyl ester carboxylesterase
VYEKGEASILFAIQQLKKLHPNADYGHISLVGHSNGGDTSMYFAQQHPELVSKVITLDNLRVPFVLSSKLKILSFRSKDPNFITDPGVLPTPLQAKADGIDIIRTPFQHTWMSDRGPHSAKQRIQSTLDQFLGSGSASALTPVDTDNLIVSNAAAAHP